MKKIKKSVYIILVITCLGIGISFPFLKQEYKEYEQKQPDESVVKEEEDPFLIALKAEKYFIESNLERYLSYSENKSISTSKIISDVNANLDKEMYIDVKKTNTSDENLMLVNKYYYLTEDYEPNDLVTLSAKYNTGLNSKMRKEAADKYSARPGFSEHQTGLTTDINIINDSFEKTPAFKWLQENAYKFGFILRFPKEKEYMTGYKYESWHYRYVGVDAALQMYDENLTLEEYYAYYVQKNI